VMYWYTGELHEEGEVPLFVDSLMVLFVENRPAALSIESMRRQERSRARSRVLPAESVC